MGIKLKFKKITLICFLLMVILTLGAASAADGDATSDDLASDMAIDENLQVDNQDADETNLQVELQANATDEKLASSADENSVGDDDHTFDAINAIIEDADDGAVINISGTYVGDGSPISVNGDEISLTIVGKDDATLDARGLSKIIEADFESSLTMKNIKFINSVGSYGDNGWFTLNFINCTFINCINDDDDNGYIFSEATLTGCKVMNCNATESIMYYGQANNCIFENCLVGSGEYCLETGNVSTCTFTNCRNNVNFEAEGMVEEFTLNYTGNGWINEWMTAYVYLPYGVSGSISFWTDEDDPEEIMPDEISLEMVYPYTHNFRFKEINKAHYLKYEFVSDDGDEKSGTINFPKTTNYEVYIDANSEELIYGTEPAFEVSVPDIEGTSIDVYVNGNHFKTFNCDDVGSYFDFTAGILNVSQMTITVTYNGDGKTAVTKRNFTETFDVLPRVTVPESSFNDTPKVIVDYVKTTDSVIIMDIYDNIIFEGSLADGQMIYEFEDKLDFGESNTYSILFRNSTSEFTISAGPIISLPQFICMEDAHNFTVEFPQYLLDGWSLSINIDENVLFEGELNRAKLYLALPENIESGSYSLEFKASKYDDELEDYNEKTYSYGITIYDYPANLNLKVNMPDSIAVGNPFEIVVDLPEGVGGTLTLFIDGSFIEAQEDYVFSIENNNYAKGTHNYTIRYTGTDYYKPITVNGTFKIENYAFNIPDEVIINSQEDEIEGYVQFDTNAKGTLTIYLNGKEYDQEIVEPDDDNKVTLYLESYFSESEVKLGNNTVRLLYKDSKGKKVFDKSFNVYYDYTLRFDAGFDYDENGYFRFGDENYISVYLPSGALASKVAILVNNETFTKFTRKSDFVLINVTDLAGEFTVTAKYLGDSTFTHPVEVNETFFSKTQIIYQDSIAFNDVGGAVSLRLPADANGKLVVTVDGSPYAAADFISGYASVSFANLSVGNYQINAYYNGTDYPIAPVSFEANIEGRIMIEGLDEDGFVKYGKTIKVYLYLPTDAGGRLVVSIDEIDFHKDNPIVNGYAEIIIKADKNSGFYAGEFDLDAGYEFGDDDSDDDYDDDWDDDLLGDSEDGEGREYYVDSIYETIMVAPSISIAANMVVFGTNYITVNTYDEFASGTLEVLCDDNGETFAHSFRKELDDGRASVSLSSLTSGKHQLVITYYGDDGFEYSQGATIDVKKAANPKIVVYSLKMLYQDGSQFKAKIYGTDGKVLKNKIVTIYINNKKVKNVKTNAYGYAYYKIPNLPGKYNAYVTYAGTKSKTAKITVSQIMTFKAVFVKKSAKSLVLTATLKKVKGKYLKNKVITFKFNGIVKKAKTNSKGVAKVTYANGYFKKLPVGKKVYYQATYVKTTIKKIATVKK